MSSTPSVKDTDSLKQDSDAKPPAINLGDPEEFPPLPGGSVLSTSLQPSDFDIDLNIAFPTKQIPTDLLLTQNYQLKVALAAGKKYPTLVANTTEKVCTNYRQLKERLHNIPFLPIPTNSRARFTSQEVSEILGHKEISDIPAHNLDPLYISAFSAPAWQCPYAKRWPSPPSSPKKKKLKHTQTLALVVPTSRSLTSNITINSSTDGECTSPPRLTHLKKNQLKPTNERCCQCTSQSSCKTNKCPCRQMYKRCSNCYSFNNKCKNTQPSSVLAKSNTTKKKNQLNSTASSIRDFFDPVENLEPPTTTPTTNPSTSKSAPLPATADATGPVPTPSNVIDLTDNASPNEDSAPRPRTDGVSDVPNRAPTRSTHRRPAPRTTPECGDKPGTTISPQNRKLDEVYGDHIHENPGDHLSGGVQDDGLWQKYLKRLLPFSPHHYDVPRTSVGKEIISSLAQLLEDIMNRKCNMDKFLVFQMVILQRSPKTTSSSDIKRRLGSRLSLWKEGKFSCLVDDTALTLEASLSKARGNTTPEHRAKVFDSRVKRGKLRSAVRYITDREGGGVLSPNDIDEKSGSKVIDVLKTKHPEMREPGPSALKSYENLPSLMPLHISEETVEAVASKLSGSAGLSGMDSSSLKSILLQHGGASKQLRLSVAKFVRWMSNDYPPWAAYRALMMNRLVALNKSPGVRPLGIGDVWRRLFAKCNLVWSGPQAQAACGSDQLCAGLSAGIEGGIHGMSQLWAESEAIHKFGFLLVDARNAFNEINRVNMLWTIRHEWPAGAKFAFNCYKHQSHLICRSPEGCHFNLLSKEGVTQGDPLSMFAYGIGILPLIKKLKVLHPACTQPWYADDAGAAGTFESIASFFKDLLRFGPDFGYFPEPTKSVLVARPIEADSAEVYFNLQHRFGFQISDGHRYLGGFIGSLSSRDTWLQSRLSDWIFGIRALSEVATKYPQTAYAGLQKSLQQEWTFLQRVLPEIGPHFEEVEKAIHQSFLPALFGEKLSDNLSYVRPISSLPVRYAGLAIPNPSTTSSTNYGDSTLLCSHLIRAIQGKDKFMMADHSAIRKDCTPILRQRKNDTYDQHLTRLLLHLPLIDGKRLLSRSIERAKETGQWLSCMPSQVSGTELGSLEFRDAIRLRYGLSPLNLPDKCDGCGAKHSLDHALTCKVGGLIIQRHDEINKELAHLASLALKQSAIRAEPLINPGSSRTPSNANPSDPQAPDTRERGDLLIRNLWENGTDCIIDVRVTDLDAPSYVSRSPAKVLASHEQQKKKKYVEDCLHQRRSFCPFVISTDGMLGFEAKTLLKQIARKLSAKWERRYSVVCGLVRARLSIACVRATHLCLRGSRIPFTRMSRRIQWTDSAGLGLFQVDRD